VQALENKNRNVVPRWRDSAITSQTLELASVTTSKRSYFFDDSAFRLRVEEWGREHSLVTAAELLNAAIVVNKSAEAQEAAKYLLLTKRQIPETLANMARRVQLGDAESDTQLSFPSHFDVRQRIRFFGPT
jgi:hypothetical protein